MFGPGSLKPKYGSKKGGILPFFSGHARLHVHSRKHLAIVVAVLVLVLYLFNPLGALGITSVFSRRHVPVYPRGHPLTSHEIVEVDTKYIYPPIEHAQLLRELTMKELVKEHRYRDADFPDIERYEIFSLNKEDDPDPIVQRLKEEEENQLSELVKAKNYFKNQDKIVYKGKGGSYPEVVIVTTINFDKYSMEALAHIVQNRVDYAHAHGYGIYVRWSQEFLPALNSFSYMQMEEKEKWTRLFATRAAMFAFPKAKWFWYLDEDALIMDSSVDILDTVLSPSSLNSLLLREQPIIPPSGIIKTYKNTRADTIRLILVQSPSKVETTSFIVKNDDVGESLIQGWCDKLFVSYSNFPFGPDSAITHILQWHPYFLSKTAIVPTNVFASIHPETEVPPPTDGSRTDFTLYHEGDFVATWWGCKKVECEKIMNKYYAKIATKA